MNEIQIINDVVFWTIGFLNILTYFLAGDRSSATWYVGTVTQSSWIGWQLITGNTTFLWISIALLSVNVINLIKWRRAGRLLSPV
ncbi:MAG TPA: hypothetical protein ENH55_15260 [Aurantimonas coralicida]|uniref:Uncharacterized protein n=2 Tax=root TaxID=1 RepID=A0A9C9TJB4_9HYPH|nr:hypothetical protein [Aurantimonas coralicida]HEU02626.1 hypothetical protein [Aurantimonas coralicida]